MKKTAAFTAVLWLLLFLCTLTACSSEEKTAADTSDSLAGSYHLVDAAGEGSKDLLELKKGVRLEVRSDNTATLSLINDVHELTFDPAKMIVTSTEDDQEVPYTFDGKQLTMETAPFRMVFER